MALTKIALVFGLLTNVAACVDELDEETSTIPTEDGDGSSVTDNDGIPQAPDLPDHDTCASQKQADSACVPAGTPQR